MPHIGQTFTTGNAVITTLPKGSTLQVTGQGQVQITHLPKPVFHIGDRVLTKYGPGTVARPSSRLTVSAPTGSVFYIADSDPVLRVAQSGDLALMY